MDYCCSAICAPKGDIADNITHHLRFIDAAAEQACKVLIFPELSLTGPNDEHTLPAPPCDSQLQPLRDAAQRHRMTIIAGLPMENAGKRIKGIVIFAPDADAPIKQQQGTVLAWRQNRIRSASLS